MRPTNSCQPPTQTHASTLSVIRRRIALYSAELDLDLAGRGGPIPRRWLEDELARAHAERRRAERRGVAA